MDPDHIDITCFRSDQLDTLPPDQILADLEEPEFATREDRSRPAEILGQVMSYIFARGLHPVDVFRRRTLWLLSLESSVITYRILNSRVPSLLTGSRDDICNAFRLKPIPGADAAATTVLQSAIDRRRIKVPTFDAATGLPIHPEGPGRDEAEAIGEFFTAAGPEPRPCDLRIYITAKAWFPHHLGNAALQVLGDLSGESRQAWQTRSDQVIQKIIEATGSISHGAGYTATESHKSACSESGKAAWAKKKQAAEDPPAIG